MYQNYLHSRRFFDATTLFNLPSSGEGVEAEARVDLAEKWLKEVERRSIDKVSYIYDSIRIEK